MDSNDNDNNDNISRATILTMTVIPLSQLLDAERA